MPGVLSPDWTGQRVTVRRAVPLPGTPGAPVRVGAKDVVGDLLDLSASRAVIAAADGPVEVPLAHVLVARLSPPAARDALELEQVAARAWPAAEQEQLDGWLLRADPGGSRRANSVLTAGRLHRSLAEALAAVTAWYARRGADPLLAVPLLGRSLLDAQLREDGWQLGADDCHVLAVRADRLARAGRAGLNLTQTSSPDDAWWRVADGDAASSARRRELLTRNADAVWVTAFRDGEPVAAARGVADGAWLGVTSLFVLPAARRTGVATALLAELAAAAAARGAERLYLQVSVSNQAAIRLYERLGFWHHHDYRYLRPPT